MDRGVVLRIPVVEPFGYEGLDRAIFKQGKKLLLHFQGVFEFSSSTTLRLADINILLVSVQYDRHDLAQTVVYLITLFVFIVDHCTKKKKVLVSEKLAGVETSGF